MPRQLTRPVAAAGRMTSVAPVTKGGTGASTPSQAVVNLGGVSRLTVGQPNGLAQADHRGFFPSRLLSDAGLEIGYSVHGPRHLAYGETYRLRLTNYNSTYPAAISISAGSAVLDGDEVVVTAPLSGESVVLTVGDREIVLALRPYGSSLPEILYPVAGSLVSQQVTITIRPFKTVPELYTAWMPASTGSVEVPIPAGAVQLEIRGRRGLSGEAKVVLDSRSFQLPVSTSYRKIDILLYGNATVSVSGSGQLEYRWIFNTSEHVATDWQVSEDPDFTAILAESLNDSVNLLNWTVELSPGDYYVRTRFHGSLA